MAAQRLGWLATCLSATLALPAACGDSESTPSDSSGHAGAADAGESSGGSPGASAGASGVDNGGIAGVSMTQGGVAGRPGGGSAGAPLGSAGALVGSAGAAGGAGAFAGEGGAGGAPLPPTIEQLSFCPRLTKTRDHSNQVVFAYDSNVYNDSCVHWVTLLYAGSLRTDFYNRLVPWNLRFWGCQGDGVDNFLLTSTPVPLSAGDATLLIDHYLDAATGELQLSPDEQAEMRAALERLSLKVVVDPSTSPSHTECLATGGVGGAAGEPGGAGGDSSSAGAPATGVAGAGASGGTG